MVRGRRPPWYPLGRFPPKAVLTAEVQPSNLNMQPLGFDAIVPSSSFSSFSSEFRIYAHAEKSVQDEHLLVPIQLGLNGTWLVFMVHKKTISLNLAI